MNRGEGFAFFRWMSEVVYPQKLCGVHRGGWQCIYCQERWGRTTGKDKP